MTPETEQPYIARARGGWIVAWATSHDAPMNRDRNTGQYDTYTAAERACLSAYGVTPQPYGIGF